MSIVEISVRDLVRVLPFRSTDDVRYYLNGIFIEPIDDGCMIVATNGHFIGAIHSKGTRVDKPRILSMSRAFETAIKEAASGNSEAKVTVESEYARAVLTRPHESYIEPGPAFIDGTYPQWRKVIPPIENLKPGLIAALQSKYVSALNKAAGNDNYASLRFWHDDRDPMTKACVVRYDGCPDLIVIIMPMSKFNDKSCVWPSWFTPATAPATEAA